MIRNGVNHVFFIAHRHRAEREDEVANSAAPRRLPLRQRRPLGELTRPDVYPEMVFIKARSPATIASCFRNDYIGSERFGVVSRAVEADLLQLQPREQADEASFPTPECATSSAQRLFEKPRRQPRPGI